MASKRPTEAPADASKRARSDTDTHMDLQGLDDCGGFDDSQDVYMDSQEHPGPLEDFEVVLDGKIFINLNAFHDRFKRSLTKYGRSVAELKRTANLSAQIVAREHVEQGRFVSKPSYSTKSDLHVMERDEKINQLIAEVKASALPPLPKISDADLKFFEDAAGKSYYGFH